MPGKIEWIQFKGVEIVFNNRSRLKPDEISVNVREAVEFIKKTGKKDILYLIDNSANIITPDAKEVIRASGKELAPYLKKTAVVGVNNAQSILINILAKITRMDIRIFDDPEKAKEWLVR